MKFTSAGLVEQVVWDMRLADLPRGENRALIDRLGGGLPPYTRRQVESNRIKTNVNFLEFPELCADARRTYTNAFLKPGNFFNIALDSGAISRRGERSRIITKEMNRVMKRSPAFFEFLRSQFAMTVMHGIGPGTWPDREKWCLNPVGIEDVMIPSNTRLSMDNLSYFAIYKELTAMELYKATHGPRVDKGWQMDEVNAAIRWADEQTRAQIGYSDLYAPQKVEDRWKQDLGFYGTDAVPTINAWDFYFWSDEGKKQGWRRRMIVDTPCAYEIAGRRKVPKKAGMPKENQIGREHGHWLYHPGDDRVYATKLGEIIHFQFGDASAVAPFKYHSVRSLGWLLYAVCHLQNRLRCKVNDAIFESLLQYFRSSNPDDKERILKIDLTDLGLIPEGITMVPRAERWQIDQQLVGLGLGQNQERMQKAAAQYREGRDDSTARKEKTATEIMSEVNAANALVGAMLLQAYQYAEFQGIEIARRFARKYSTDPDVQQFRARCIKRGVPEKYLDDALWEVSVERTLGSGNKTLEIAMADQLQKIRPQLDPEGQRKVTRITVMANSDIPELVDELVPEEKTVVSDTRHDSALALTTLLQGIPVPPKRSENQIEVIETWLSGLGQRLNFIQKKGMPTIEDFLGLQNVVANIGARIKLLAQDPQNAERAKGYEKALGAAVKMLARMQKALQQAAKASQGNGNGEAQAAAALEQVKLRGKMMTDAQKLKTKGQSEAQKLQHKEITFRQKMRQDAQKHMADLQAQAMTTRAAAASKLATTAADIAANRLRAANEPSEGKED